MNGLVSICIPTYKGEKFIERTIKSVLNSTYLNLEIIVSDDSSNDTMKKIVNELNENRIKLIRNKKRKGVPWNWNSALEAATGKYVGLLNHDDEYGPFWIDYAVNVLERHPDAGLIVSAFRIINENSQTIGIQLKSGDNRILSIEDAFSKATTESGFGFGYIARRALVEEIGYYDTETGPYADYDFIIRMASKYLVYYSNNPSHLAWRMHQGNLTKNLTSF